MSKVFKPYSKKLIKRLVDKLSFYFMYSKTTIDKN